MRANLVGNGLAMGLLGSVNFSIAGIRKEDFFFFFLGFITICSCQQHVPVISSSRQSWV